MVTMTDITHDPDFPFAIQGILSGRVYGKFRARIDAELFINASGTDGGLEIIDTTPKPKIPADAHFITWGSATQVAVLRGENWLYMNSYVSTEQLVGYIGDRDVIVLEPRS